jgi:hypothetical protein
MNHILEGLSNGTVLLLKYAPDDALFVTHAKGDGGCSGWISLPMEYHRTIIQTPEWFVTSADAEDHMHHIIKAAREMIL